ncbi:5'-3' exonuclease [Hoyosella sp. YIM 151337]|uniref:5'-3' exonuclease n=1 Tax=Hoyosella sp. YIM 151337 TaxID=2992742 RepID=UPI0022367D25|nr:5'-3' exonuclease [Hoyosella sp. YIM 151337]MCW4353064.1 5'-3' exonuclease [Hoyosella sp. YIM 151337]
MTAPLMLLDGASLWFRAFYALPESLTSPDGRPVNAVRGFTDMVAALVRAHRPGRLVVCLDNDWRPQFRVDAIPSYKAHRVEAVATEPGTVDVEEVPDTLTPQVDMILEVLDAFGIATAGADGYEADDVLGTLSARETTAPVIVVSGDRDLLQVVRHEPVPVRVLYVGRGLAKAELFGPDEVAAKYGVPADRAGAAYAELALLRGDPSDGLPGVAGIGEKTASRLLLEHGSLAALIAAANDPASQLSAGLRTKLTGAADYIQAADAVVRVACDAPVAYSRDDVLPSAPADRRRVAELTQEYGLDNAVARLTSALAGEPGQ